LTLQNKHLPKEGEEEKTFYDDPNDVESEKETKDKGDDEDGDDDKIE
jgi:hypothetical protein